MMRFPRRLSGKILAATSLSIASFFSIQSVQAASLAKSSGEFAFSRFSSTPLFTDADSQTLTLTTGDDSEAEANADALFEVFPTINAANVISNFAFSSEVASSASSQSTATVIGSFFVEDDETFSFDFTGLIHLATAVDSLRDTAEAALATQYSLFGQSDAAATPVEIDFFAMFGQLSTPSDMDSFGLDNSDAVMFESLEVTDMFGPVATKENLSIEVSGRYERLFKAATTLTLIETKQGRAFAQSKSATDIPEHSSPWVWLLGTAGVLALSRQQKIRALRMLEEQPADTKQTGTRYIA
ncbi:MAG: hypothetical protein HC800_01255 [Phormidesmis sp. RL_2_1]|nr:hypothetical protein [Phormidesmis sp. RL_2_1]